MPRDVISAGVWLGVYNIIETPTRLRMYNIVLVINNIVCPLSICDARLAMK